MCTYQINTQVLPLVIKILTIFMNFNTYKSVDKIFLNIKIIIIAKIIIII